MLVGSSASVSSSPLSTLSNVLSIPLPMLSRLSVLDTPNRYSRICRKGIITCPNAYSGPQPENSRFQAPVVHRFTSYRLLRICKCIASHTYHRITSLPAGFGQCFFAALQTELKILVLSYNPIAASSSCSLHEMSRQLLLDIQLSWFILGSPLTSSNY